MPHQAELQFERESKDGVKAGPANIYTLIIAGFLELARYVERSSPCRLVEMAECSVDRPKFEAKLVSFAAGRPAEPRKGGYTLRMSGRV